MSDAVTTTAAANDAKIAEPDRDRQALAAIKGAPMSDAEANQTFGALSEGLYVAAHSFERAMARVLALLKGDGWRRVGPGYDDVNQFVRDLQLDRFKVLADQRKEFIERVKELQPKVSNRAIAGALGVDESTVRKDVSAGNPAATSEDGNKNNGRGKAGAGNPAPGAADGRRDARIIAQRDEREERREEKLRSLSQAARLSGRYSVFYADPPWEDEFGPNPRQTERHYPVMALDDIKAFPVDEISAPDAVLYMWALPHMIEAALEVMAVWGFDYRTQMIWGKDQIGIGQWVRNQHEPLLIGRRGAFPPPPEAVRSSSLVMAPRGAHSAKPELFLELIEQWYPDAPKIELFRRGLPRPGWAAWGNEVKGGGLAEPPRLPNSPLSPAAADRIG